MNRLAHSWSLFKTSLGVVKQDKELLWMPVLSFFGSLAALASVAGVAFAIFPAIFTGEGEVNAGALGLVALLYILLAFVALFFNAAVVAGASERLAGGDPTLGSALKAAWAKKGKLFLWSIVVATVNVILQAIRERSGFVGQMMASFAGLAWNLATFFMVPVLLFEDRPIGQSVKQSGSLFKKTWGETVVGHAGVGFVGMIVGVVVVLIGVLLTNLLGSALGATGAMIGIVLTVLSVIFVAALFSVVAGVYKAAVYRYATTGQAVAGFSSEDLGGAFTRS